MKVAPAAFIMQRLLYVVGPGVAIIHAGTERRHAGSGGWPHTGSYCIVHTTPLPATVTESVLCAEAPEESCTTNVTVYVPAVAYVCVNVPVCTNAIIAFDCALRAYGVDSSPHVTLYVSVPFSGSVARIAHVPDWLIASVVGPDTDEITGGLFPDVESKYAVQ